jgi:hypothetical protein
MSSLNISVNENGDITINGTRVASINYVDNEISEINIVSKVQDSVFKLYNGVHITNAYPPETNGTYIQLLEQRKLVVTKQTARFFKDGLHNIYVKPVGDIFYALIYVEPATSTIFESITTISQPVWLILRYKSNPETISSNIDHYGLFDDVPVLSFLGYETNRFGSQSFPNQSNVEFF